MREITMSGVVAKKLNKLHEQSKKALRQNKYALIFLGVAFLFYIYALASESFYITALALLVISFFTVNHYGDKSTRATSRMMGYLDGITDFITDQMGEKLKSELANDCEDCDERDTCENADKTTSQKSDTKKNTAKK